MTLRVLCRCFGWHRWQALTHSIAQDGTVRTRSRCARCSAEQIVTYQDDRFRWGAGRYPV